MRDPFENVYAKIDIKNHAYRISIDLPLNLFKVKSANAESILQTAADRYQEVHKLNHNSYTPDFNSLISVYSDENLTKFMFAANVKALKPDVEGAKPKIEIEWDIQHDYNKRLYKTSHFIIDSLADGEEKNPAIIMEALIVCFTFVIDNSISSNPDNATDYIGIGSDNIQKAKNYLEKMQAKVITEKYF